MKINSEYLLKLAASVKVTSKKNPPEMVKAFIEAVKAREVVANA